ncbi:MAG: recombinase family protein [Clostridia bacterium]|nr:recombinase family protein [Clostridia bacterium]
MAELLKIAAAYIRVSDERQDEYSPDSQLKKIREHAAKEGYLVPDEYVFYDDGISAKSTKKRDEFNRMIAIAKDKSHPFDVIYVWKFSRFARNQEESMVYKNLLRKKSVSVVSVSEPIPEGHFGTLVERIIEWMDEFYLINLGAEVVRGMTEKASRGEPTCAPPFGYIMEKKKYLPDTESGAAAVVCEIFARYANGEGQREIAVNLGERGVRTRQGNPPDNRWIEYILHNPCYIGKIRWSMEGARAVSKRDYENENILTVDGHHEPLISTELWEKVQHKLEEQKKKYAPHARKEQTIDYMLKGLVQCSSCGATLAINGRSGKSHVRCLQCCNYARGSCHTSHSVTLPKIEAAFIRGLEEAAGNKQFAISPAKAKKSEVDTPDFEKLIALEQRRLERAKDAYLSEIDTIEQYGKNKAEITARIKKLTAMRDKQQAPSTVDVEALAKEVLALIAFLKRNDVTDKAKNEAIRTMIDKVVYCKPSESISIFFRRN